MKFRQFVQKLLRFSPRFRGKHRLSRMLLPPNYQEIARDIKLSGHFQCVYLLPHIIEYSYWEVFYNGIYEPDTLDYIINELPQNGCFLDVGANIDLISIPLAKRRPDVSIYAIEADPNIFSYLQKNIQLNKLSNIHALNFPVHEQNDLELPFYTPKDKMGCGSFTPLFTKDPIFLSTKNLDNIAQEQNLFKVDFIKIDIEGYEYYAVKGAQTLLERDKPSIIFEFVDWAEEQAQGLEKGSCQKLLHSLGFELFILKNKGLIKEKLSSPVLHGSEMLVAVPR